MKYFITAFMLLGLRAQAAHLDSATYNAGTDTVRVEITYGGCNLETFEVSFGHCMETFPYQIRATVDDSQDTCLGVENATLEVPLDAMKDCRPATLTLRTASGSSRITVQVPE